MVQIQSSAGRQKDGASSTSPNPVGEDSVARFVKNIWYVAAWSSEIEADTLLDRTIAGNRIVFFRDESGVVVALRNRCCHRSAPLSMGARDGDGVRCGYHGLKFDRTGRCVEIPGQQLIPAQAKVDSFAVQERHGWIWVWTGVQEDADPALITEMKGMDDPDLNRETGYLKYKVNYQLIHDNLLDFSHVSYVHAATFGGTAKWAFEHPELKRLADGFWFERWLENIPPPPFVVSILGDDARQDILQSYDIHLNGALTIDTQFQAAGAGTRENLSDVGYMRMYTWQAVTPATPDETHYFYANAIRKHLPLQILKVMQDGTTMAFEEDRCVIEAQQELLVGSYRPAQISSMATAHDGPLIEMRKSVKRKIGLELAHDLPMV